mmetsp:Transcript_7985/g.21677  ORF Transcript_7985/g.21677 Transcript_7985/m.21677 type:complete len:298 (+) Transcript_7985:1148-2041(+)
MDRRHHQLLEFHPDHPGALLGPHSGRPQRPEAGLWVPLREHRQPDTNTGIPLILRVAFLAPLARESGVERADLPRGRHQGAQRRQGVSRADWRRQRRRLIALNILLHQQVHARSCVPGSPPSPIMPIVTFSTHRISTSTSCPLMRLNSLPRNCSNFFASVCLSVLNFRHVALSVIFTTSLPSESRYLSAYRHCVGFALYRSSACAMKDSTVSRYMVRASPQSRSCRSDLSSFLEPVLSCLPRPNAARRPLRRVAYSLSPRAPPRRWILYSSTHDVPARKMLLSPRCARFVVLRCSAN